MEISLGSRFPLTLVYGVRVSIRTTRAGLARLVRAWLEHLDESPQADFGIRDAVGCFPTEAVDLEAEEFEFAAILGCDLMQDVDRDLVTVGAADFSNDVYMRGAVDDANRDLARGIKRAQAAGTKKKKHPLADVDITFTDKKAGYYLLAPGGGDARLWFGTVVSAASPRPRKGLTVVPCGDRHLVGLELGEIHERIAPTLIKERAGEVRLGVHGTKKSLCVYDASELIVSSLEGVRLSDLGFLIQVRSVDVAPSIQVEAARSISLPSTANAYIIDGACFEAIDLSGEQAWQLDQLVAGAARDAVWVIAGDVTPLDSGPYEHLDNITVIIGYRLAAASADDGPVFIEEGRAFVNANKDGGSADELLRKASHVLGAQGVQNAFLAASGPLASAYVVAGAKLPREEAMARADDGTGEVVVSSSMNQSPHEFAVLGDVRASCGLGHGGSTEMLKSPALRGHAWLIASYD